MDVFDTFETPEEHLGALRLSRDLREAARVLSPKQQRILVDLYYMIQDDRERTANQARQAKEEPNAWVTFLSAFMHRAEKLTAGALEISSNELAVSRWAKSIYGIGPVIAAGLAAYIDITKTPSVSGLWRLAGLDPTSVWKKGEKRPWNAQLKVLRWKIGDSFCKFHNRDECFYGKIYAARKILEVERNEAGLFREQAEQTLANWSASTHRARATREMLEADSSVEVVGPNRSQRAERARVTRAIYEAGKLPPGRLEARARRVAVKLFLSHYWEVAYYEHYGKVPPLPYIVTSQPLVHKHYVPPPGYEEVFVRT